MVCVVRCMDATAASKKLKKYKNEKPFLSLLLSIPRMNDSSPFGTLQYT
jgi:hypothetical protein